MQKAMSSTPVHALRAYGFDIDIGIAGIKVHESQACNSWMWPLLCPLLKHLHTILLMISSF